MESLQEREREGLREKKLSVGNGGKDEGGRRKRVRHKFSEELKRRKSCLGPKSDDGRLTESQKENPNL